HLGGGAMGSVYLADDSRLEIRVAVKVPHPHLLDHPQLMERFHREARAAARLDHPGLCWVFDVGQVDDTPYLVMRYIEGVPLTRCVPPTPRDAAALVLSVALAMASAHRQGVVHRDLKPSNILVTPAGQPVVTDFGVARLTGPEVRRITVAGAMVGTLPYMAPEQLLGDPEAVGPWSDVYGLGVILYELLAGRVPFENPIYQLMLQSSVDPAPDPPSAHRPGVDAALDGICLTALARRVERRYANMEEFATTLDAYLGQTAAPAPEQLPKGDSVGPVPSSGRPPVDPGAIRFAFAGLGEQVPAGGSPPDRLYLDVGNDRRPGVIDHHQERSSYGGSTARLVLAHPELVDASAAPRRDPGAPFTLVLHRQPDLDCVASAYLAVARLTTGAYPEGAEALARYVDRVDEGALGLSLENPASLYAAYQVLSARLAQRPGLDDYARWRKYVRKGIRLVHYVVSQGVRSGIALPEVDAFAYPGLFGPEDRREFELDIERYRRKLDDPATLARQVKLRLPGQYGGTLRVEALLVRDVQGDDDSQRCLFFKDWARSDAARAGNGRGFIALSVFQSEGRRQPRRCILSVTPDGGVSLRGLGEQLDRAEGKRRRKIYGEDDRVVDPATGAPRAARVGYGNSDPWYDGRAHGYTIVDAPRSGTLLTADEVEAIFLRFGGVE
ncbi:MAG: serine/threonine protein kinase, partial [Singulisphaera sp.]|nr:serine/threonine protein kinase [Singulisphaera sp.]